MDQYIEVKRFIDGGIREYFCQPLYLTNSYCILKYVLAEDVKVSHLLLPKGTTTLGFYWQGRPYLVYCWYRDKEPFAYYFSIIDQLRITQTALSYRDLVIDVLVDNQLNMSVLDREELSPQCPEKLRNYINSALEDITQNYGQIIANVTRDAIPFLTSLN